MTNQEMYFTLDNGEWVTPAYARKRIINSRVLYGISLDMRRKVADRIVAPNSGYRGVLVSYLCRWAAWATYMDLCIEQLELDKHPEIKEQV